MCCSCVCVCVSAKGCACVLCLGIGWNSTWFLPCRAWQIKNIADRSKNFHTHLFLFTARNLHIKAEQKDDTARYPFNTHTLPLLSDTSVALRVCVCVCARKGSQISDFDTSENIEKFCVAIKASHGDGVDVDGTVNI